MIRFRKAGRCAAAFVLAAGITAGSLGAMAAQPAFAAPAPNAELTFKDPSGANWTVPAGVSEIWVGLAGGDGGAENLWETFGKGNQVTVLVPVKPGDVITTYSGYSVLFDAKRGGRGYMMGGEGGKGNTANNGAGGGAAGAVELNGELIAVAGGGGGMGGANRHTLGGAGGSANDSTKMSGANGAGSSAGKGAKAATGNGTDWRYPRFSRVGEPGGDGTRLNLGGAGGGGGGGGGWPSSGTGGKAGGGVLSEGSGGGGAAGFSWSKPGYVSNVSLDPATRQYADQTLQATPGTSRITIPLRSVTSLTGTESVPAGEPSSLQLRTWAAATPAAGLDGSYKLWIDGIEQPGGSTSGDTTIAIPALAAGSHTAKVHFTPSHNQTWQGTKADSEDSFEFTSTEAPAPAVDDPAKTDTVIQLRLPPAIGYGERSSVVATVSAAPGQSTGLGTPGAVSYLVDGKSLSAQVDASGNAELVLPAGLAAGTHVLAASYLGGAQSNASHAEAASFDVASAPTTVTVNAPSAIGAFRESQITATVASSAPGVSGHAELFANGEALAGAPLDTHGVAEFLPVQIPWGTTELTAVFTDENGNFASSTSAASPISVAEVATTAKLSLSVSEAAAGDPVTATVRVENDNDDDLEDPRGEIEIISDGAVVDRLSVGLDKDPEARDGEAVFVKQLEGLDIGPHKLHARFVPAEGFAESATATPQSVTVAGIESALTADLTPATATTPAIVNVKATAAGKPAPGYVQAFVNEKPIGDPTVLDENGAGTATLAGLAKGSHEVTVRFMPASQGVLQASDTVTVVVPGADGGTEPPSTAKPGTGKPSTPLATTGANAAGMIVGIGAAAAAAAGALLLTARRRGRRDA